jgi:hypothetical protein
MFIPPAQVPSAGNIDPTTLTPPIPGVQQPANQATPGATAGTDLPPPSPAEPTPDPSKEKASAQNTLLISELRDDIVVMKDGSFRAVIICQSINFDLMSTSEQESVEYAYQSFLNSLNFNTQILIRSQRIDIGPYIDRLVKIRNENDNMLLGILMDDYIAFISDLAEGANIMDKSFFIVVPYFPTVTGNQMIQKSKGMFADLFGKKTDDVVKIDRATYEKAVDELNNRCNMVMSGLGGVGIRSARLNTNQLATLYYNFNNPDTAIREPLVDFNRLAQLYVRQGEKPEGME